MALRFPNGWIYQPALANSEPYPMEALQKIADQVRISRPDIASISCYLVGGPESFGGFRMGQRGHTYNTVLPS